MKSVTIVYKRPNTDGIAPQFRPVKSIKKSVDQYLQKLKSKQQSNNITTKPFTISIRPNISTSQTSRITKHLQQNQITNTINIAKIKYSTDNIFKHVKDNNINGVDVFNNNRKENSHKFRSTFVKKTMTTNNLTHHQGFYSLKGIRNNHQNNVQLFTQNKLNLIMNNNNNNKKSLSGQKQSIKNTSKLVTLKKIKLTKPKTILISVDFILNQFNFWSQQKIDQLAYKNWKILEQYSNIVWLTKRQNSLKKLQKYAKQNGLRLDGVYKIQPNKKTKTLMFSLANFEKDLLADNINLQIIKKQGIKKEIILINSLKMDSIKNVSYEEFYNLFPVSNVMRSVVHFIQIDMNDKFRFNSPLKILSKQKLPSPNQINHLFAQYYKDNNNKKHISSTLRQNIMLQSNNNNNDEYQQEQQIKDEQQIMNEFEQTKQRFLNYFGNHLKLNLSKKVKVDMDNNEQSIQYLVGDMLKRNYNLLSNYHVQAVRISGKLERIRRSKQNQINNNKGIKSQKNDNDNTNSKIFKDNFITNNNSNTTDNRLSIDRLLNSKLINKNAPQQQHKNIVNKKQVYFNDPVFLWRK